MDNQPQQQQSKHDRSRTKWTASLDKLFVELVLEQVLLGNRSNNVFNKKAWKHIRDEFNKQTSLEFDRKQLKKHLDVLRNRFDNVKAQFVQGGGDDSRNLFITGADVWDDYIEDYPVGEPTKIKDFPIYDQLCKIFTDTGGIGRYAQSSHYIEFEKDATTLATETPSSGIDIPTEPQKHAPITETTSRKRKRKSQEFDNVVVEAMVEMAKASKLRVDAYLEGKERYSVSRCVKILDEMDEISGVEERVYYGALDLFESCDMREMFLAIKMEKRLLWLQWKCKGL